ncbi:exonuclease [Pedobacter sp. MC2016-15]|uniref:exonuclease n=1 Tax=Pedobacter sp. MC2016-15 TaxID=2994473 RepID=UPI0022456B7C|nr:exonuclease [Pedobacter sp. MC2016-15]MCX2480127.1 exonuclease [Pedobacter sp. MC2016-15]
MILEDFLVPTKIGLFCAYGGFYLDPKEIVKDAVISHAHGDHAVGGNINVYCTEATSLFMKQRYKKFAGGEFHVYSFHQGFVLNEVRISFVPAGHMLGSALVLMEYQGIKYLYTGDYKLQPDDTCEPIEFVKADVLITETTFADPETSHPDAVEEILKLNSTQSNIMLGAYALGKSQRLIRLISDHCPEKRILVHHSILPFVKIYESLGIDMGKYEVYDRKVMKANLTGMIYLVPPLVYRSYIKAVNVIRVFATGWKHLQNNNELQLYISDHVDWKDIILTIEQVSPSQVWTTHGSGKQLKEHFQNILDVKLLN